MSVSEKASPASSLSPLQIWLLAARPKTLPAAAVPVIVGSGVALAEGVFRFGPALAALLGALLIQIGTNFANDVFDYKKGADTTERLGPLRVTQAGLLTPAQVMMGMWLTFGLAAFIGLYLVWVGGWPMVVIGLLSIASGIAYTGGPFPLGYNGLGDLFVFIFFGLVAVCGTYYVQAGLVSSAAFWASLPVGFLATAILVVNNLRDINTDRAAGKKTLAVRFGAGGAQAEYVILLLLSYAVPVVMWLNGLASLWVLLTWLSIPLAISLTRLIFSQSGRPLNAGLAGTARLELLYGVLFSLGMIVGQLV
jgi:1,4-dihydroxy-2-naphthoate octaprenyltransferase